MFLFILIARTKENDVKLQAVILGLLGSFFYLYRIFTMERVYNGLYLLYVAVFASSFWSIIYSLAGFKAEVFANLHLNSGMLKTTAISSIFIAVIFTFLWITALIPLMREHNRIEFMYSIYILDLCFVMPAFVMTAIMSLRGMPLGILIAPAIMILGFFVIFPLGLNELAKPSAGMVINYGSMAISFIFAFFMLAIATLQLRMIHNGMLMLSHSVAHSIVTLWYSRKAAILSLSDTCLDWNTISIDFPFLSDIAQALSPQRFALNLGDRGHSTTPFSAIR